MRRFTCGELGVCQDRPGCPNFPKCVQQPAKSTMPQVPITMDGPFVSERTRWMNSFARHSLASAVVVTAVAGCAGFVFGRVV